MIIEQSELDAADRERKRLIKQDMKYRAKPPEGNYDTWCYCSWCRLSELSVPHYRRQDCPDPSTYRSEQPSSTG